MIPLQLSGTGISARALGAQLQESQEDLLALLDCREWVATLCAQARPVSQCICLLCLQQQGKGPGLAQPWQSSGVGVRWCEPALAEERQKSLELEEYHHSILEADWLLELEVRPILIRRIDAVRGPCRSACAPWSAYQGGWGHCCGPGCCTSRRRCESCRTRYSQNLSSPNQWPGGLDIEM